MGVNEICWIYKDCLGDSFSDDPEGLCCSRSYTILVTTDYLGTYVWLDDEEKELILDYDEYSAVRDRVNEYVRKYMIREEEKKKTRGRPKKKFTTKTK